MKFTFDHDYHIHSKLSLCSDDPEQTTERILRYAEENGLKTICLTDHFWDSSVYRAPEWYDIQNFEWISKAKPLPKSENVKFLFGCETELDRSLTLGLNLSNCDNFDFIVIPTTHLHMGDFTLSPEDRFPLERRAMAWVKRFDSCLNMPLPFYKIGMAHLTCTCIATESRENYLGVLEAIPEAEMQRLFAKAAKVGVGIELNFDDMKFSDDEARIVLRPYKIAKKAGCKFYLGSDAHHPKTFQSAKEVFERAIDFLDLEESDKFHIKGA